jgi:hypothetical protein
MEANCRCWGLSRVASRPDRSQDAKSRDAICRAATCRDAESQYADPGTKNPEAWPAEEPEEKAT